MITVNSIVLCSIQEVLVIIENIARGPCVMGCMYKAVPPWCLCVSLFRG